MYSQSVGLGVGGPRPFRSLFTFLLHNTQVGKEGRREGGREVKRCALMNFASYINLAVSFAEFFHLFFD